MPPSTTSFDWVQLVDRFGVSVAILFFIGLCIFLMGRWAGPIIREYINRRMERDDRHAEASLLSAKAASENAKALASTSEKSIDVQRENAETNKHIAATLDAIMPIVKRFDQMVFPPKNRKP